MQSVQIRSFSWSVFSCIRTVQIFSPNTAKYGPEKTSHLDTFHTVLTFKKRCKLEYTAGYNLLFDDTDIYFHVDTKTGFSESGYFMDNSNKFNNTLEAEEKADIDDIVKITEKDDCDNMAKTAEKDEAEYYEKDVIRKCQIDYDHSVCLSDKFQKPFKLKLTQELRVSSAFHLDQQKENFQKIFFQVKIVTLLLFR